MSHRAVDKRGATGEMLNGFIVSASRFMELTNRNNKQTNKLKRKLTE
jgi:hypothetical protein